MVVFEWLSKARASSLCDYIEQLKPQPPAVEAVKLISHEMDTIRILQETITLAPPQHNLWLVFKNLIETWSATRTDPRYFQLNKIAVIQRLRAEWNLRERVGIGERFCDFCSNLDIYFRIFDVFDCNICWVLK